MRKSESSLISIIAGLALSASGCAQAGYQELNYSVPIKYHDTKSPIEVNDDSYSAWRKKGVVMKRYVGLSKWDVESRLMELARTKRREDAWLYRETAMELIDIGCDSEESRTGYFLTNEMGEGESGLILYHIHPCLCANESADITCTVREPLPSSSDVAALVRMLVKYRGKEVEARVVNQFGVLRMKINPAEFRGVPEMNRYAAQFAYGELNFKEYQRCCEMQGLKIDFEQREPFVYPDVSPFAVQFSAR